jgi:hypothetical protein
MSAFSTLYFSRSEALSKIVDSLPDLSNDELGDLMDVILQKALHNAIVIPDALIDDVRRDHER